MEFFKNSHMEASLWTNDTLISRGGIQASVLYSFPSAANTENQCLRRFQQAILFLLRTPHLSCQSCQTGWRRRLFLWTPAVTQPRKVLSEIKAWVAVAGCCLATITRPQTTALGLQRTADYNEKPHIGRTLP